jgi:hypothetical protein
MSKKIAPFEEEEFEIEKEVWNVYELEDGNHRVTLKMRTILTKLLRPRLIEAQTPPLIGVPPDMLGVTKGGGKDEFQMSFQNIVVVSSCPTELMGPPSAPIPAEELSKLPTEEINFNPFNEDWNIYKIPESGLKLKIKLVVSSVNKPKGIYDQFGYPIYIVQSTNAVVPVPPKVKK